MNYEDIAKSILDALRVENTPEYIRGIVSVLNAQEKSINEQWESYITSNTNDILAADNICCNRCGDPISITRTFSTVFVGQD